MKGRGRVEDLDYSVDLREGQDLYNHASDKAQEDLANLGIIPRDEPPEYNGAEYDGRLPTGVSKMTMGELSDLMLVCTKWADFIGGMHQLFVAKKRNFKEQLDMTRAKIRKTKAGAKADKDDDTIIDSRYVQINALYMEICEKADITEHVYAAARRDRDYVSRAITATQTAMESNQRVESVTKTAERGSKLRGRRGKRR